MKKEVCKFYIFRHGQTEFNRDNRFTGWANPNMTSAGREDAKIIAERLKGKKFQLAIHTSLSRSKETLKEVLKNHPECQEVVVDDRIKERDYGDLNGLSHWQIIQKHGVEKYDAWHRSWDNAPPNGESFKDVQKRVEPFLRDLIKRMKKEKISVAISAHGNTIRLVRKLMENLSIKETCAMYVAYDHVWEYEI